MAESAQIVRLESEHQRQVRARFSELPAVVQSAHSDGKKRLLALLQVFFDRVDDTLFELADKASNNTDQAAYFDAMRELRVQRRGLEARFLQKLDEAFARLVDPHFLPQEHSEISPEALSLVQNDELEQMVALEAVVRRGNRELGPKLAALARGLATAVPLPITPGNHPFGPEVLAGAFMGEVRRLDIQIRAKLHVFKQFDRDVIGGLSGLLDGLLNLLAQHGIRVPLASSRTSGRGEGAAAGAQTPPDAQAAEQHQQALHELLTLAQRIPLTGGGRGLDLERLLEDVQSRRGAPLNLSGIERDTLRLVQMLFDFMLREDGLGQPIKEHLSRLQLPLAKLALRDTSFLTNKTHAARKLLNEMTAAAIEFEDDDSGEFTQHMRQWVERIGREVDGNDQVFGECLTELLAYSGRTRRRAAILERRLLDAEDGRARAEVARAQVARELAQRTDGYLLPDCVRELIFGPLSNVLFVVGLKHGFDSGEWVRHSLLVKDLVWSVQPCANRADRQQLIRMIPDLLQRLRAAVEMVSHNPFEVVKLFQSLEEVHVARIRGEAVAGAEPEPEPVEPEPAAPVAAVVQTPPPPAAEPAAPRASEAALRQVDSLAPGIWFDLKAEDGSLLRCRMAAFIKPTGKFIFVNRAGVKVAERQREALALALESGDARLLNDTMLFDRALESIVSSMRRPQEP